MEKAMAPHSSTLAWKIPCTEEPGRLQSMGSLRVGHDWATSLSLFTFMHWRRKWQPTPVFLPGESQGQGSLVGCRPWGSHRVRHDWSDLAAAAAARDRREWGILLVHFWMNSACSTEQYKAPPHRHLRVLRRSSSWTTKGFLGCPRPVTNERTVWGGWDHAVLDLAEAEGPSMSLAQCFALFLLFSSPCRLEGAWEGRKMKHRASRAGMALYLLCYPVPNKSTSGLRESKEPFPQS